MKKDDAWVFVVVFVLKQNKFQRWLFISTNEMAGLGEAIRVTHGFQQEAGGLRRWVTDHPRTLLPSSVSN